MLGWLRNCCSGREDSCDSYAGGGLQISFEKLYVRARCCREGCVLKDGLHS